MNKEKHLNEERTPRAEIRALAAAVGQTDLSHCMFGIIRTLQEAGKYAAVHTYTCALHSLADFCSGANIAMTIDEVFTAGCLKSYEKWLLRKELSWNSISTYMRTLRAVYNRLILPGSRGYDPKLFDDVYTKVESRTKRALTESQIQRFMTIDESSLPEESGRSLAYFRLMFLFRGMPFIDLAYLRKRDWKGNTITYCRHKTGRQLTVKIPAEAFPLLKEVKDRNPNSIYLFSILDGTIKDDYKLYLNYLDALRHFNKQLAKIAAILLPGRKVSSYTARHTWATLCFHMGTPVGIICEALGHSSIRVTETYLMPFANERIDRANDKLIASIIKCKKGKGTDCNALISKRLENQLLTK